MNTILAHRLWVTSLTMVEGVLGLRAFMSLPQCIDGESFGKRKVWGGGDSGGGIVNVNNDGDGGD